MVLWNSWMKADEIDECIKWLVVDVEENPFFKIIVDLLVLNKFRWADTKEVDDLTIWS